MDESTLDHSWRAPYEPTPPEFLRDWDAHAAGGPVARAAYAEREVQRLLDAGYPALYAALTAPLVEQTNAALAALYRLQPVVTLRLAEGAAPPRTDPYGRPLPPDRAGKVFVTKTATRGAPASATNEESARWTGPKRLAHRAALYDTVEFPAGAAVTLPTATAAAVCREWGYGVHARRHAKRGPGTYQDRWLLVEVPPPAKTPVPVAPSAHERRRDRAA